jgi:hypothetical protein
VLFVIAAALGSTAAPSGGDADTLRAVVELVFGVALLVAGGVAR